MPDHDCLGSVPVLTMATAGALLEHIPEERRHALLLKSFEWLVNRDHGLEAYLGITGRPYTDAEKDLIGYESGKVADLPCPYYSAATGCLLGGLGPNIRGGRDQNRSGQFGFLPMIIARTWARDELRHMVQTKQIADAKIAFLTRDAVFLTDDVGPSWIPKGI